MDVILHLGAHRTGTTSFQAYLEQHRDLLLQQGLLAMGPSILRRSLLTGLMALDQSGAVVGVARRQLNHDLDLGARAGLRAILLSEENLIGRPRQMLASGELYPDLVAHLQRLGPQFRGRVTRVGLALRDYGDFWASLAAFGIHYGVYRPQAGHAEAWARKALKGGAGWPDHVDALQRAFPRATILVWRAEREIDRPARVLAHLDRDLSDLPQDAPHMNASRAGHDLQADLQARGALKAAALVGTGRYMPFDTATRCALTTLYNNDIARISRIGGRVRLLARGRVDHPHNIEAQAGYTAPAARRGGENDVAIRRQDH